MARRMIRHATFKQATRHTEQTENVELELFASGDEG